MAENKKYCMGCMLPLEEDATVCPNCFYNTETENHSPALKIGSIVSGRYLIGKVLFMANDSITYIGRDLYADEILSITEFYPQKILSRENEESTVMVNLGYDTMFENCRESFLSLWRGIDMFKDETCLPKLNDIIEANGTVYVIAKYLDSINLTEFFAETKKPLSWARAHSAFKPILSAIQKLHAAGIIHGNISPETVHVGSDGKLHIMYFSIPQCYSTVEELRSRPAPGFTALELYSENAVAKKESDVYSVMALLYYAITGIVPPIAPKRAGKDTMVLPAAVANTLSNKVIECFVKSLSVYPQNRIQSIDEIIDSLAPLSQRRTIPHEAQEAPQPEEAKEQYTENEENEVPQAKKSSSGSSKGSLVKLSLITFFIAAAVCTVLLCALYSTVLYKSIEIPFLDKALGSFSFLPMNEEKPSVPTYVPSPDNSTEAPTEKAYVTVPDFSTHTRDSITTNEIFNERFIITFSEDYSDTVPKNSIISQSVEKGASVLSGTPITVVVSLGPSPIELPQVIGMQYNEAKKILEERGFTVTKEVMENKDGNTADEVYLMNKVAGLEFEKGTEIILSVWDKAPEKETTKKKKEDKKETSTKKNSDDKKETTTKKKTESKVTTSKKNAD